MAGVTKESLASRIADLEYGPRSLKEDYTLAAYKMLLATMEVEPVHSKPDIADAIYEAFIVVCECHPDGVSILRNARKYTDKIRHAQPAPLVPVAPGWIPVSERVPDENAEQQVLVCFKGGDISALYYSEGRWDDAYGIVPIRQDVTHWMPLPAGPVK